MMFRSPKLLSMAKDAPCCFHCLGHNDGTVVAAHSNQIRDGKGKGIKAHDYRVAFLHDRCLMEIDQGKMMSKDVRREAWEEAHRKTVAWLFETGRVKVV